MLPLLVMQQPTNGVAATAACTGTNADGASKESDDASGSGGGEAVVVDLPLHLTEKLLRHMTLLESARLAVVCKSWASTVSALLATPAPQLYVCTPPDISSGRRGLVASVFLDGARPTATTKIPAHVRSSDTSGLRCVGATPSGRVAFAAGWLTDQVLLVNPLTGARRSVHVGKSRLDHSRVLAGDAVFAADGCTRMLWRPKQAAAPCGGGGDAVEEWSACAVEPTLHQQQQQQQPSNTISAAVSCDDGRFYLLHKDGSLSVVDATAPPPLRMEKLPVPRVTGGGFYVSGHLLESDGEVLLVQQPVECTEEDESISVCGFEVHSLDVKGQRWTKVNELAGDRALFVSPGSSFAVRASETLGCRRNCIYFVGKKQFYSNAAYHQNCGSSWGVYSMEEGRVLFEHPVTGRGSEAVWFLPRVALAGLVVVSREGNEAGLEWSKQKVYTARTNAATMLCTLFCCRQSAKIDTSASPLLLEKLPVASREPDGPRDRTFSDSHLIESDVQANTVHPANVRLQEICIRT